MRQTLILMVKEPRPGRVKTRLGRDIGMIDAAWWFRHQARHVIRSLQDPRWQMILAVSPDAQGLQSRVWPHALPRMPQGHRDLGRRMAGLFRQAPKGSVCIIGADIPNLSRAHIACAFARLGANDAVFGPATDGGYWLVGLKHAHNPARRMFDGVRWSTEHALSDTLATLPGLRVALVDTMQDVDTLSDLRGLTRR